MANPCFIKRVYPDPVKIWRVLINLYAFLAAENSVIAVTGSFAS